MDKLKDFEKKFSILKDKDTAFKENKDLIDYYNYIDKLYGSIKDNKLEVEDFIKQHTHYYYCEAILYPDGTISYVKPSHTETLIRATGMTHKEVYEEMPVTTPSVMLWLLDKTRCVAIYYDGYVEPPNKKITLAQKIALKKLTESDIVSFKYLHDKKY